MVYRIYKDKKLICASEDKRKAFKSMRDAYEPNSHYHVEYEEDGKTIREQYDLTVRSDGRVSANKRSSKNENSKKRIEEGKQNGVHIWLNQAEYQSVVTAANASGITVSAYIKSALLEKLHSESYL